MKKFLALITLLSILTMTACQGTERPVEYLIEVTRLVTVIVTEAPESIGAIQAPSATTNPASPSPELSPTPSMTATPDAFPTPEVGIFTVAQQVFEHGYMFWLEPIDQLWVLHTDETGKQIWSIYEDSFVEGMPEVDASLLPPISGLYQPVRGFGTLWRENEAVQEQLGWGLSQEVGYTANYQYHYGGTVDANQQFIQGPGYHLVETLSGEIFRFNEGIWTWEIVEENDES